MEDELVKLAGMSKQLAPSDLLDRERTLMTQLRERVQERDSAAEPKQAVEAPRNDGLKLSIMMGEQHSEYYVGPTNPVQAAIVRQAVVSDVWHQRLVKLQKSLGLEIPEPDLDEEGKDIDPSDAEAGPWIVYLEALGRNTIYHPLDSVEGAKIVSSWLGEEGILTLADGSPLSDIHAGDDSNGETVEDDYHVSFDMDVKTNTLILKVEMPEHVREEEDEEDDEEEEEPAVDSSDKDVAVPPPLERVQRVQREVIVIE